MSTVENNDDNNIIDMDDATFFSVEDIQNTTTATSSDPNHAWRRNVATKRKSLMHSQDDTLHFAFINPSMQISAPSNGNVKMSSIFKSGHGLGSVFIDITEKRESISELFQLIAQQYPSRMGALTRTDKNTRFIEINFDVDDPALDTILEKGLEFNDQSIIIACKALHYETNIMYICLYHLPLIAENLLFYELKAALSRYGNVLDIGILVEPITNTYMCDGYAIMDTKCNAQEPLKHIIQLDSYNHNASYAVWKGMPHYCPCCHEPDDHAIENCPKHKPRDIHTDCTTQNETKEDDDDFIIYTLFALKKSREAIDIAVKTLNGANIWFRNRKRTGLLGELKREFSEQQFLPLEQLLFDYNEHRILDDDTPKMLKMNDGATIVTTLLTM